MLKHSYTVAVASAVGHSLSCILLRNHLGENVMLKHSYTVAVASAVGGLATPFPALSSEITYRENVMLKQSCCCCCCCCCWPLPFQHSPQKSPRGKVMLKHSCCCFCCSPLPFLHSPQKSPIGKTWCLNRFAVAVAAAAAAVVAHSLSCILLRNHLGETWCLNIVAVAAAVGLTLSCILLRSHLGKTWYLYYYWSAWATFDHQELKIF